MNDNPAPLSAEQVDDLLSAELDGELAAAALDLGLDEAEAQARLDATPGVAQRRAQLAAASAAIADLPELDDVTEARLRSTAIAASADEAVDLRKRRRAWTTAASAAAVVVAVLGIAAIANHNSANKPVETAASPNRSAIAPTTGISAPFRALGNVESASQLQTQVELALGSEHQSKSAMAGVDAVPAPGSTTITNADSSEFYAGGGSQKTLDKPIESCDAAARLAANAKSPPVLYATATLNHQPVTVYVYLRGTQYAIVASDQGCTVVLRRTLNR
jgi:hypothetical protein